MLTLKAYEDLAISAGTRVSISALPSKLLPLWFDEYMNMNPRAELVTFGLAESGSSFTYLFDLDLNRIVAVCGFPIAVIHPRDASRQKGHPKPKKGFVKGHLIAHSIGGGMDINFVPQLRGTNAGEFRKLENLAQKNALENVKSLYFVRAIYNNKSDVPHQLEQCLIPESGHVLYRLHSN